MRQYKELTFIIIELQINGSKKTTTSISWCQSTCDAELALETELEDIWDEALERCSLEFAQNFMM